MTLLSQIKTAAVLLAVMMVGFPPLYIAASYLRSFP